MHAHTINYISLWLVEKKKKKMKKNTETKVKINDFLIRGILDNKHKIYQSYFIFVKNKVIAMLYIYFFFVL
jgi:hypothetical protein